MCSPQSNSFAKESMIMQSNTQRDRDPMRFSLTGTRSVNSHAMVPVIPDDGINTAWDARLARRRAAAPFQDESAVTLKIEDQLARYFAHGCCDAA
jgi:hypothetical protein